MLKDLFWDTNFGRSGDTWTILWNKMGKRRWKRHKKINTKRQTPNLELFSAPTFLPINSSLVATIYYFKLTTYTSNLVCPHLKIYIKILCLWNILLWLLWRIFCGKVEILVFPFCFYNQNDTHAIYFILKDLHKNYYYTITHCKIWVFFFYKKKRTIEKFTLIIWALWLSMYINFHWNNTSCMCILRVKF